METRFVKDARESGNIEPIVRAGLMAFGKGAVSGMAAGLMMAACMQWWHFLYHGAEIEWGVVEAAEDAFRLDVLAFMRAVGLA